MIPSAMTRYESCAGQRGECVRFVNHRERRGFDEKESAKQRYECKDCGKRFDDLTGTIFSGHHQPLKVWILCLYFMGLNLSNDQIAKELDLNRSDVGSVAKKLSRHNPW